MDNQKEIRKRRQPKKLNIQIGERCRKAREAAGYTQEQLAERIGVSTQFLSDSERGVTGMSVMTIIKICNILDISTDFLLLGYDSNNQEENQSSIYTRIKKLSPQEQELVEQVLNLMIKLLHMRIKE